MKLPTYSTRTSCPLRQDELAALKAARIRRGWSFEQLARKAGYGVEHMKRIERGALDPGYAVLLRWATALDFGVETRLRRGT